MLVPGEGFEPSVEDPKSSALPLGHPGSGTNIAFAWRIIPGGRVTSNRGRAFDQMMRYALLGALLLVTTACGAYAFPGGGPTPTPDSATVSGRVVSVPCAPLEQAGTTCAGRPVPKLELDYTCQRTTQQQVLSTVTDGDGHYSVVLPPGRCTAKFKTYMRYISGPLTLEVKAGADIVANYVFDNGIRVPAPQQ